MEQFKNGGSVSGTLQKHKQKIAYKPSVQAVFGSGNPDPGNTQSGAGDSQESGDASTVSVKGLAEKFQDAAVKADVLPAASKPAENKPALLPKPEVSDGKPVVTAEEKPLSEESGEENGSAATEVASIVKGPVEETESDAEEKPKTLAERVTALKSKETTADEKTPVSKKTATSRSNDFSQLKAKFAK